MENNNIIFENTKENIIEQSYEQMPVKKKSINFLQHLITVDIDENGKKIFVSKNVSEIELLKRYKNNKYIKFKRVLLSLKNNNYIKYDGANITVTEYGIHHFLEHKKNKKKLHFKIFLGTIIVMVISIIIAYLVCEIKTEGLFLNSYTNSEGTYKFYLSTYEFDGYYDDEKGRYEIVNNTISFDESNVKLKKYKNILYYKENRPYNYFECIPCKKTDKNTFVSEILYESQSIGSLVLDGEYGLAINLNDDGTFVFNEDNLLGCYTFISGKYKNEKGFLTFEVENTQVIAADPRNSNEKYKMYGLLVGDTLYPNVYKKN